MERVPLEQFLADLAEHGLDAGEPEAREDLASLWQALPAPEQEAYLDALGIEAIDEDHPVPHLEGDEVVFGPDRATDPADLAAAEAFADQLSPAPRDPIGLLEDLSEAEDLDPVPVHHDGSEGIDDELDDELDHDLDDGLDDELIAELTEDPGIDVAQGEAADLEAVDELEDLDGLDDLDELDDAAGLEDLGDLDDLDELGDLDDLDDLEATEAPLAPLEDLDEVGGLDEAEVAEAEGLEESEAEDPALADTGLEELAGALGEEAKEDRVEEIEVYPVYEPYAYVRISYDSDNHQYLYEVIEPELSEREEKILAFIEETIIDIIDVGLSELTEAEAEEMVKDLTEEVIRDYSIELDENARTRLTYYTVRDFTGFGKLDVIMRDPMIEDISCDGSNIPIFLYHRKYESVASTTVYVEDQELDSFVIKLAQRSGKHISIADPLLDARLPDGSRLNATLSREVTAQGSTFTIRKFRDEPFTPPDLVRFGTQSAEMLAFYWMAIQHGASLIMAGGTASGKTTALNAIMLFIPPQMKIVSIEDTRELNLPHPNWIPGTTRAGFGSRDDSGRRAGEIDMFELLKAALRQRPEYIAVGEVRGEEATVLFQAMATGHSAYGTMHADSVTSVIHRLEGQPINIPRPLLEALDIVTIQIQTRIGGKRVRRTKEIVEIVGLDPNTKELLTNEVFHWDPATDEFDASGISYVLERIQKENNLSKAELQKEMENRTLLIQWMVENEVRDYKAVAKVVQAYYNEPDETVRRVCEDLGLEEGETLVESSFGSGAEGPSGTDDIFGDLPPLEDEPGYEPAADPLEEAGDEEVYQPPAPAGSPAEEGLEATQGSYPGPLDDADAEELEDIEEVAPEPWDDTDTEEVATGPLDDTEDDELLPIEEVEPDPLDDTDVEELEDPHELEDIEELDPEPLGEEGAETEDEASDPWDPSRLGRIGQGSSTEEDEEAEGAA